MDGPFLLMTLGWALAFSAWVGARRQIRRLQKELASATNAERLVSVAVEMSAASGQPVEQVLEALLRAVHDG